MTRLAPEHFPTVTLVHVPNPDHKVWYTCMHMLRWDQGMGKVPSNAQPKVLRHPRGARGL